MYNLIAKSSKTPGFGNMVDLISMETGQLSPEQPQASYLDLLPIELILAIADQFDDRRDAFNLARARKSYYQTLPRGKWQKATITFDHWPLPSREEPASVCLTPNGRTSETRNLSRANVSDQTQCSIPRCEACWLKRALLVTDNMLATRYTDIKARLRDITFKGVLSGENLPPSLGMPAHSFLGLGGIVDICPEVLNFELHWSHWTSTVLFAFDTARLRSLTIPVRSPSDCIRIRLALKRMPNLESLTIKEIPDIQDFIDRFHHLGRGILALAPTLRALSLSLTNMNRKSDWEKDEAFVEPDDLAFFFKHFFPEPTPRDIAMLARRRFLDPREDTDINILQSTKGPLNIETMELRHIGLPWWAFQTVFNPSTIKTLSLPKCKVEPTVWDDLGSWCKLITLTRISYDMLPGAFLRFLSAQNELRALSFMRPCHKYDLVDVSFEWNQLTAIMGLAVVEPSMGPGTAWGRARARDAWHNSMGGLWNDYYHYPKRSAFVSALSHKRSLKHLVLPPNMFDVTPAFLAYLAIELPALENLELGFDYDCPELREAFLGTFLPTLPHMKKITLLSLSRPEPLSSFDAWQSFFPVLNLHSNCRIPSTLKYIRYCGLPNSDGRTRSLVYYHRENPVNGMWWLAIRGREGRRVYEDGTTPSISSSRRCNKKGALQGYGFEGKLGSCRDDFLRG